MLSEELTRRVFLQGSGTLVGSAMIRAGAPVFIATTHAACTARDEAAAFENLTSAEAREVIAIAARIMPTTDTPGATEAGVVYFVDKALGTYLAAAKDTLVGQLADFQSGVAESYPSAVMFSDLDEADQDAYLRSRESTPFFDEIRTLTIRGVFAMSSYGGNRDDVGWKLVGMDGPPHAWTPPFGYYDAAYMKEHDNGE